MLDLDVAFLDVDIRRAILAHGSELDQMAIGPQFANGEEQIQRADDVVDLRETACLRSIIEYGADRCSAKWITASGWLVSMADARKS